MWRWDVLMITISGNKPTLEGIVDQPGVVIDYSHGIKKKNQNKKGRLVCSSLSFFITEENFSTWHIFSTSLMWRNFSTWQIFSTFLMWRNFPLDRFVSTFLMWRNFSMWQSFPTFIMWRNMSWGEFLQMTNFFFTDAVCGDKIGHVEKFSPWHVKWENSPHEKCGDKSVKWKISPHEKGGENLSRGEFLHMRKVEKIFHVEKFLHMRDVKKICPQ